MIKTKIKMMVTPEQSRKVQEICFKNGLYWAGDNKYKIKTYSNYLYIDAIITHDTLNNLTCFTDSKYQEINADLFIKTNGTCEESSLNELYEKVIERVNEHQLQEETYLTKYTSQPKDLESALKKIENLHIALNKKVEKNKNQALEITKLLEQKKDLQEEIERLLKHEQTLIDELYKNQYKELDKFEEIKKLNTIISYLESKLK